MRAVVWLAATLVCAGCASGPTPYRNVSQVATEDLCRLRLVEGNFSAVIAELERRGAFSEEDLLHIRQRAIVPGMSAAAVRCSYGVPQQIVSNSPGDDFDLVYIYGLELPDARRLGETRVYLADGRVVRREESPTFLY